MNERDGAIYEEICMGLDRRCERVGAGEKG